MFQQASHASLRADPMQIQNTIFTRYSTIFKYISEDRKWGYGRPLGLIQCLYYIFFNFQVLK